QHIYRLTVRTRPAKIVHLVGVAADQYDHQRPRRHTATGTHTHHIASRHNTRVRRRRKTAKPAVRQIETQVVDVKTTPRTHHDKLILRLIAAGIHHNRLHRGTVVAGHTLRRHDRRRTDKGPLTPIRIKSRRIAVVKIHLARVGQIVALHRNRQLITGTQQTTARTCTRTDRTVGDLRTLPA